jgi:ABC-2 type transport system ATP-binding protein
MNVNTAITVEKITKIFGNFRAVDDLSFTVSGGEIFALLGPNGAGKSTTIRMILDILKPDSGKIEVLGGPLNDTRKDRIGYLPEERGLYRNVPVLEMMVYLATLKGMSGSAAKKRSMELLHKLELTDYARNKVSDLSKGMQQKVQFAVTVLHEPDLVIVDEPFAGLDPVNRLVIKELLTDLRLKGCAIVMSTHQMNQVEEMADRLLMIADGQQKLYGPVDEIRRRYALHAIVVAGDGDWSQLSGVEQVVQNGREGILLHLKPQVTADEVLAEIASAKDIRIERFEMAVPSLDDIFIQVVEEG